MKVELFQFQKTAVADLRQKCAVGKEIYRISRTPQVISLTAPTGAGKTIIASALIENIYCGDSMYDAQQDAIVVWLSDSPQLNEQSKEKIERVCDKLHNQLVTIAEDSFDQEILSDGTIYFLNTQKLGKSSNLVKHSDTRQYTIWETLQNTILDKAGQLYFIIDEAHRGAKASELGKANTIMQKFILGSKTDGLNPMPLVIGMSATSQRFKTLIANVENTGIYSVTVPTDAVRKSGLLKDIIKIDYPDEQNKDMAVLQAAADEWMSKCKHWHLYCQEQHYKMVNPIFLIQVENGTKSTITATDLGDCIVKIEEQLGIKFEENQVVHSFGSPQSTIQINGLNVPYVEPSQIESDRKIQVVFFKDTLSTGWDCPRAETMMSFRNAQDSTYIAQLLGRMIRTPQGMRVQVDESLNEVHLFLPNFNRDNVEKVVKALQDAEGADIPTDISSELIGAGKTEILTVQPVTPRPVMPVLAQPITPTVTATATPATSTPNAQTTVETVPTTPTVAVTSTQSVEASYPQEGTTIPTPEVPTVTEMPQQADETGETPCVPSPQPFFDRLEVLNAINGKALLTYDVRSVRINDYLTSLFKITRLLSQSGLNYGAKRDVLNDIIAKIRNYIDNLKSSNQYDELVQKVKEFKMHTQSFDAFGATIDDHVEQDLFSTTNTDIERQFRKAESILRNEGVGNAYGRLYADADDVYAYMLDVILFTNDAKNLAELEEYAKVKFHSLKDAYRTQIPMLDEAFRYQYDKISSDADEVSRHNFTLPQSISAIKDEGGKHYTNHLYVNNEGYAQIKLNGWEEQLIEVESQRADFVCWVRNSSRKPWALALPYTYNNETKKHYPDFIVVRKDEVLGYMVDILEPHNGALKDNLAKAKGLAEYAKENINASRIQLIRQNSMTGKFLRLDLMSSLTRDAVLKAHSNEELDSIFSKYGVTE